MLEGKTLIIDETLELKPNKDYPFRESLLKKARCGMCAQGTRGNHGIYDIVLACKEGKELIYPLIVGEHDCDAYEYKPHYIVKIPENEIKTFMGRIDKLKECDRCSYQFYGYCSGLHWWPFEIKNGMCEFFRDKKLICKHAIPHFQYGETTLNNYCKLPPKKREGNSNRGWKWLCPNAHDKYAEHLKCYRVKKHFFFSKKALLTKLGNSRFQETIEKEGE